MGAPPLLSPLDQALAATWGYSSAFGVFPTILASQRWLLSESNYPAGVIRQRFTDWQAHLQWPKDSKPASAQIWRGQVQSLEQALRFLRWIPWVQAVWVTGSLAATTPQENDDVDFLVLTSQQRLWITRLVVLSASAIFRRWRWRLEATSPRTKQTWCWNIWLEPSVGLQSVPPSLYTAREIVQARLVFRRQGCSATYLLDQAPWVSRYSARGVKWARQASRLSVPELPAGRHWWSGIVDILNLVTYRLQYRYIQTHLADEKVTQYEAWFHRGNYALKVQQRYETMRAYWIRRMQSSLSFTWPAEWTQTERERLAAVARRLQEHQARGKRLVLATGVFDLFHQEHQNFLTKAAQAGDLLLVGIESDSRVKSSKGPNRPSQNQTTRQAQVAHFPGVTEAVVLPEKFSQPEHHRALLALFQPAVLAVSSHSPYQDRKAALMAEVGGELQVVHQHNPRVSTTQLLESTMQSEHEGAAA